MSVTSLLAGHSPAVRLYTAEQVRQLDRTAIDECDIPGIDLMRRAGAEALRVLREQWPAASCITVYCGSGNNAGDGFVLARLAQEAGLAVEVLLVGASGKLSGDARQAYDDALQAEVAIRAFSGEHSPERGVVVDALLGTGIRGEVRETYRQAIEQINRSGLPVLAIDIPSGLCSDTGALRGCVVRARHTVTFIGRKQGLYTAQGPACTGQLHFCSLQVPDAVYQRVPYTSSLLFRDVRLSPRPRDAHKGHCGHVLIVGGDYGMAGAVMLAAEAAARCGAGLVSVATRAEHLPALLARRPEVMGHAVQRAAQLEPLLEKATMVAIGPGLGASPWSEQMMLAALKAKLPLVMDADALNLLARHPAWKGSQSPDWILTPHPGEAARLLDCTTAEIQADRFRAVKGLQKRYGGVALLKGAGTLICSGNEILLCDRGNPGMATGGMGDVLSGVIAALRAQGLSAAQAAAVGAGVHADAADLAAREQGERGLLASDLFACLRRLLNLPVQETASS